VCTGTELQKFTSAIVRLIQYLVIIDLYFSVRKDNIVLLLVVVSTSLVIDVNSGLWCYNIAMEQAILMIL